MDQSKSVPYIFATPVKIKVVDEVLALLSDPKDAEIRRPSSLTQMLDAFNEAGRAVIVVTAATPEHLKLISRLATKLAPQIKEGRAKIFVVSPLETAGLHRFLKTHGCENLISDATNPKGLKIKLQRGLALLEKGASAAVAARVAQNATAQAAKAIDEIIDAVAIKDAEDCWVLRMRSPRKVQGLWIIQLMGPGPSSGRWVKATDLQDAWHWTPHDSDSNPFVKQGRWTFFGRQPEHQDRQWSFVGEKPALVYTRQDVEVARRFHVDDAGGLILARNSETAQALVPLMQASFAYEMKSPAPNAGESAPWQENGESHDVSSDLEMALDLGEATHDSVQRESFIDSDVSKPSVPEFLGGVFGDSKPIEPARMAFYRNALQQLAPIKPKLFGKIVDLAEAESFLRESAEMRRKATIWTRGQGFRSQVEILGYDATSSRVLMKYPPGVSKEAFLERLNEIGAQELLVNANLARAALFFTEPVAEIRALDKGFELHPPIMLFEVQRREYFRYHFPAGQAMEVLLSGIPGVAGTLASSAVDISAGGFCLCLDARLSPLEKGAKIDQVSFKVYNRQIRCAAQVRWSTVTHAGIQFLDLDLFNREGIKLFVMEESYEYLKRYLPLPQA